MEVFVIFLENMQKPYEEPFVCPVIAITASNENTLPNGFENISFKNWLSPLFSVYNKRK